MGRPRSPYWQYVTPTKTKGEVVVEWQCNFCERKFKASASRIKPHLEGIKNQGISICEKIEEYRCRDQRHDNNTANSNNHQEGNPNSPMEVDSSERSFDRLSKWFRVRALVNATNLLMRDSCYKERLTESWRISPRQSLGILQLKTKKGNPNSPTEVGPSESSDRLSKWFRVRALVNATNLLMRGSCYKKRLTKSWRISPRQSLGILLLKTKKDNDETGSAMLNNLLEAVDENNISLSIPSSSAFHSLTSCEYLQLYLTTASFEKLVTGSAISNNPSESVNQSIPAEDVHEPLPLPLPESRLRKKRREVMDKSVSTGSAISNNPSESVNQSIPAEDVLEPLPLRYHYQSPDQGRS